MRWSNLSPSGFRSGLAGSISPAPSVREGFARRATPADFRRATGGIEVPASLRRPDGRHGRNAGVDLRQIGAEPGETLFMLKDRTYDFCASGPWRGDGADLGHSLSLGGSRHLFFWRLRPDAGRPLVGACAPYDRRSAPRRLRSSSFRDAATMGCAAALGAKLPPAQPILAARFPPLAAAPSRRRRRLHPATPC